MKHLLFTILLLLSTYAIAAPRWTQVSESKVASVYVQVGAIPNHGKVVTVWFLADYKVPLEGWSSALTQERYDCINGRQQTLQIQMFGGPMGKGRIKHLTIPPKYRNWHTVIPGSSEESFWLIACNM